MTKRLVQAVIALLLCLLTFPAIASCGRDGTVGDTNTDTNTRTYTDTDIDTDTHTDTDTHIETATPAPQSPTPTAEAVLPPRETPPPVSPPVDTPALPTREEICAKYADMAPSVWGEAMDGIISVMPTDDKVVAITLDACGWGAGSGYDEPLIDFLTSEKIPATLFISGKWIEDNPGKIEYLASFGFFEIENHGYLHRPLSVTGRSQYGITGTGSVGDVYDEIENNARRIEALTGRRPVFFRTGTAYYDDVSVQIAADLGQIVAGYTIAADGGASFSAQQILNVCRDPENGAILLFHMNHPESGTCEGIKAIYRALTETGYAFVRLGDC